MRESFGTPEKPKKRGFDNQPIYDVRWENIPMNEMTFDDWKRLGKWVLAAGHDIAKLSALAYIGFGSAVRLIDATNQYVKYSQLPECSQQGSLPDGARACRWTKPTGERVVRIAEQKTLEKRIPTLVDPREQEDTPSQFLRLDVPPVEDRIADHRWNNIVVHREPVKKTGGKHPAIKNTQSQKRVRANDAGNASESRR